MNNARRADLQNAINYLNKAMDILSEAADDETLCLENMPENLSESDRCLGMEDAIDRMNDAVSDIGNAICLTEEAIG